jgi:hypothetical protein
MTRQWILCLLGVVLVAHAAPKSAIYNALHIHKSEPYGVGAVLFTLDEGKRNILLPGHYATFDNKIYVHSAAAHVAKKKNGHFIEAVLPKSCLRLIKKGHALYVRGHVSDGALQDVSCRYEQYQSKPK